MKKVKEFKVDERIRFKQWTKMKNQYGISEYDNILCNLIFLKDMKHLCGTLATIENIYDNGQINLKDFESTKYTNFYYSTDMITHIKKNILKKIKEDNKYE